ncbi:MAG TPA: DUF6582 domain-containing protein [Stellaceae bacterium]|nr:DUF6582 domain-containing protein [Stellaceae bacterium]
MRFYWPIAKVDGEQRMVWGYASTEAEDDQGETVTRAALAAALDDYMRFANIREMHQPSAVGIATEAAVDERGLYLGAKIIDGEAWAKVTEGVYKGFSIGGRVTERDPSNRRLITGLRLTEISVVDRPANPEAVFDCWKLAAAPATGDLMLDTAPSSRALSQIWDCGVAGHRHLVKAAAIACIAGAAPGTDTPIEHPRAAPAHRGEEPTSGADYADPGYRPDGRQRYPIDSDDHIRGAWAYIHQPHNAGRYSAAEIQAIKARIVAAWKAKIDPAGPPSAAFAKGLAEVGRLAQIIVELDWLYDRIALEAAMEADASPLPQRMQEIIAELCDFLEALAAEEGAELVADNAAAPGFAAPGFAAMAHPATLRKSRVPDSAALADHLAKFADAILPRLDALQQRVEDIAQTPLPPQTIARGFTALAKHEDGGSPIGAADGIVAALARMSEEERTLTLIKAAHANPIGPTRPPTR